MSLLSEDREPFRLPPVQGMSDRDGSDLFSFAGSVGPNGDNRREDVIKAQLMLGQTGDYDFGRFAMPTGWPSSDLYRGIKAFQKRNGKQADGTLLPVPPGGVDDYGVGETLEAFRSKLGEGFAGQKAPTPREVDAHYDESAKRLARGEEPPVVANRGLTFSDEPPAQPPQAKPGQQVALAPAAVPIAVGAARAAPAMVNLLRGVAGALGGAAAASFGGDTPSPEQAAPADHDQARTPDPAQPEIEAPDDNAPTPPPLPKGRVVLAPDGTEVNVPALGKWVDDRSDEDRERAEEINDALAVHMIHHDGNRGSAFTQQGIDITIQACLDELNKHPDLAGKITHQAGGHNESGERRIEEYLSNYDEHGNPIRPGSHLPDFTFKYVGRVIEYLRGNTVDTKEGGRLPSGREQRAGKGITDLANDEYFFTVGKWTAGTSVETMEKDARLVCGAVAEEFAAHIRKKEGALPPDHVPPTKYPGPSSAREAEKRRIELKMNVK